MKQIQRSCVYLLHLRMGCGSSKITMVRPVNRSGCEDSFGAFPRGDSAVSKHTNDSGLGLEAGEGEAHLRRALPTLSPLTVPSSAPGSSRETSSDILQQLRNQGILLAPSTLGGAGEAYSLMDSTDRVLQKPPARLQSLKEQPITNKENIEGKMTSVEERRKVKEAELRQRLRSARLRSNAKLNEEEDEDEDGRAPDTPTQGLGGAELETDSTFLQHPNEEF
ncbi:hypothetical protein SKAU_G00407450 [Synaphobranchus kaupii]|uniref:Stathmin domain containing 1 n=1 Tax=Synaphobranchus kaupii TaxID=118154 RepID=A0A9Q1EAC0_SYNKA|nr:hypothetical protein SKAU_G00407450 [Synaphobranchus kaupii]